MIFRRTLASFAVFLTLSVVLGAQSAEEIVRIMDEKQSFDSMNATGSLITNDRFGQKKVDYISWSRGNNDFLIEFVSAAERGQKILRTSQALYLYYPDAEELIRLQGAALRQSLLGSDISYEDMTEGNDTLEKYHVSLKGEEKLDGMACYVIDMEAKSRKVAYPRQIVYVNKESFLPEKVLYFSKSGKILKEMRVLESRKVDGKNIITRMILEDKLKKNSSTEMLIQEFEVNVSLASDFFSLDQLSW